MTIIETQRRYRELGRIRIGAKDERGYPTRLDTFRLTSFSAPLLEAAAQAWGGEPHIWQGAPTEGRQYELITEVDTLEVVVPPQDVAARQLMEAYSRGGVVRRCDGQTEMMSGRACLCDPEDRMCVPTTHVLFMLPQLPDIGVWRLTSKGWNAAAELPATVDLLRDMVARNMLPSATLAIETRTSVVEGKTKHYSVPVLRLPYSLEELQQGRVPVLERRAAGRKPPLAGDVPALPDRAFSDAEPVGDARPELPPAEPRVVDLPPAEREGVPAEAVGLDDAGRGKNGEEVALEPVGSEAIRSDVAPGMGAASEPSYSDQERAFLQLVDVCHGSLERAAAYVNRANQMPAGSAYSTTSVGNATVEELQAATLYAQEGGK